MTNDISLNETSAGWSDSLLSIGSNSGLLSALTTLTDPIRESAYLVMSGYSPMVFLVTATALCGLSKRTAANMH